MSYPRERVPYGMAGVPVAAGGVPTMAGVPGMAGVAGMSGVQAMQVPGMSGMTAVQTVPGMAKVPNGMGSLYQSEKPSSLYASGAPAYQSLAQAGYLTPGQPGQPGQPGLYQAGPQHPGYLSATSPSSQQRYMVSPSYPGAGYSLTPGGLAPGSGYTLSPQTSSMPQPVYSSSYSTSPSQSQYPTYIGSQLGPMQISASQNPYAAAAAATGHPLYPGSPYAGLQMQQMQQAQVQAGQMGGQIPGRPTYSATGLPLGYPTHATSPSGASYYPAGY